MSDAIPAEPEKILLIIQEISEVDRGELVQFMHDADTTIFDAGIDSLDLLDISFAIQKEYGIKLPLEKWTRKISESPLPIYDDFGFRLLSLKSILATIDHQRGLEVCSRKHFPPNTGW